MFGKKKEKTDLLAYIREGRTMTRGEKLRLIVSLSIPSILAQISATVMFFIDASMVGHLGAKASAAIGLVETTGWLMGGLASAANMGFSVQVAHFIGANDFESARRVLRQSIVCCLIWALAITLTALAVGPFLPYWLGGTEEIAHDASLYFMLIGVFGLFFQMEGLAGSMLKCSGNMKIPSMLNIGMCIMDVIFNYFFIYLLNLGVMGAAMGTGLAEIITAGLMFYFLLWRSEILGLWRHSSSYEVRGTRYEGDSSYEVRGTRIHWRMKRRACKAISYLVPRTSQLEKTQLEKTQLEKTIGVLSVPRPT
ncbi:MAG: polysaccharide biosynthesis C-terminal domain-containing protein [Prevotella sp.]|nr:polysaccharide biosynthesis C-terminal domain-containing protein [Prevotella sp.]